MNDELELIVQNMLNAGESEDNIALVIQNYAPEKVETITETTETPAVEDTELVSEDISLDGLSEDRLKNIKSAFDQGIFKMAEREAFDKYKETGEIDVNLLPKKVEDKVGFIQDKLARLARGTASTAKGFEEFKTSLLLTGTDIAMDVFKPELTNEQKIQSLKVLKGVRDASSGIEGYDKVIEGLGDYVREYDSESITDDISKAIETKDLSLLAQAADRAVGGVFESAPSLALAYLGTGGLIALGTSAAGNKFDEEFEENPEEGTKRLFLNSVASGTAEATFELVTRRILGRATGLMGSGNKKAAKELIDNYSTKLIKRIATDPLAEGVSEAATEFTVDLIDLATLKSAGKFKEAVPFTKEFDESDFYSRNWKKWSDAGIIGTVTGGGIVTTRALTSDSKAVRDAAEYTLTPESDKKIINEAALKINKANEDLKEATNNNEISILENRMIEQENIILNTKKKVSEELNLMKPEELKAYAEGIDNISKARKNLNSKIPFIKKYSKDEISKLETENLKLVRESVNRRLNDNVKAVTKEAEKIGKTVNTFKTAEEYQKAYNNTDVGQKNSMNVQSSDGFFDPNGDIYINEEVAQQVKSVNVAAHELLHGILNNSFKEPGQLKKVVNEFKSVLPADQAAMIQKRIDDNYRYEKFDSKNKITTAEQNIKKIEENEDGGVTVELKEEVYNEEYLTAFADLIGNKKIKFNENIFTRVGNFLAPLFRGKGYGHIRFNTGKDVFEFIKDYQKQIEEGELKPDIIKLAEEGAKGKLMFSKSEVTDLAKQYKADPAKANVEQLVKQYNNVALKALGYDISKGTIAPEEAISFVNKEFDSILRRYDGSTEFSTWINSNIRPKRQAFYEEQIGKESETTSIDSEQAKQIVDESETTTDDRTEKEIRQAERKTKVAKRLNLEDKAVKEVSEKVKDVELSKVNYKTLKNLANETIGEAFGISPKKILSNANLTKGEIANAQRYIKNNVDLLKALLPDGYNKDFKSTGVPKVLLDKFYNKRSVRAKTGAGLNVQTKKPNIGSTEFLEVFGFVEGKPTRDDRNISARIIALANQTGKAITNQTVREQLQKEGMPESALQDIKSGTPTGMFSKSKVKNELDKINKSKNKDKKSGKEELDLIVDAKGLANIRGDVNTLRSVMLMVADKAKKFGLDGINKILMPGNLTSGNRVDLLRRFNFNVISNPEKIKDKKLKKEAYEAVEKGEFLNLNSVLKEVTKDVNKIRNENVDAIKVALGAKSGEAAKRNASRKKQHDKGVELITDLELDIFLESAEGEAFIRLIGHNDKLNKNGSRNQALPNSVEVGATVNGKRRSETTDEHQWQANEWVKGKLKLFKNIKNNIGTKQEEIARKALDLYLDFSKNNYTQFLLKNETDIIKGDLVNDKGEVWKRSDRTLHPVFKEKLNNFIELASKKGIKEEQLQKAFNEIPSADIRYFSDYGYVNPNFIRTYKADSNYTTKAEEYNVVVPDKFKNDPNVIIQQGKIIESIILTEAGVLTGTNAVTRAEAKELINKNLKIAPSQLKASKSTNKTLSDSKVLNVDKNLNIQDLLGKAAAIDDALSIARDVNAPVKKIRVFDFDDTLATTESDVLFTSPNGNEGKLNAEEFAKEGKKLLDEGYVFDFSEFNKVTKGKPGPLLNIAKKIQAARGTEDVFVLTARAAEAQPAIKEFLDSVGLNIPLKNITGLGNSTGEAKANWMVDKAAEGYNDFYFADDAYQNVKAVRDVMSVVDVKSKVQQAKFSLAKDLNSDFNKILENKTGIGAEKVYSDARAKTVGSNKGKFKFFIPPSAEDFVGLLYPTLAKGKLGDQQMAWYKERLLNPFARAMENLSRDRVNLMADFKALKKELEVPRDLRKEAIDGFTNEQAVRVYLWNKQGLDIPGISKRDLKDLTDVINNNPKLKVFADQLQAINKSEGYPSPQESWLVGTITTDLINGLNTVKRSKYLEEWQTNSDIIFSKENLNKMEAIYGANYREAMENILSRMKTGKNRLFSDSRIANQVLDYINGSIGAIMFFNTRSAVLQTISSMNFINWSDNNVYKAGKAFANQKQYWSDFTKLMNSDFLKDRRQGLKLNISESEIADAAATSKNKAKAALNYLLQKGFLPTQIADSFAIASGGATFYRNKINALVKQGVPQKEAEEQAYRDFREIAEESQQSSRPDKISQQQASNVGRVILAFANTPSQYARIIKKAVSDLKNKRGNWKNNVSKIIYYGAMQNLIFNVLQQALFTIGFEYTDEEEEDKKYTKVANGMVDSLLRGLGYGGAAVAVGKNLLLNVYERSKRDRPEYVDAAWKMLDFSPPIASKVSKLKAAGYMVDKYEDEMSYKGFSIDNPAYEAASKVISATTNVPLDRLFSKVNNISAAMESDTEAWQSLAMMLGWSEWQIKPAKKQEEQNYILIK